MSEWRIELLGGLRVVGAGRLVTAFESRKTAALLAYLALHPERLQAREVLVGLLWPEIELSVGRNRLKQSLASLRRQLEPPGVAAGAVLVADRFGIGVRSEAVTVDVALWEQAIHEGRLAEAAELWRGELLPGHYDDWIVTERERLNALQESLPPLVPHGAAERAIPQPPASRFQVILPATLSKLYGRESELAWLHAALDDSRWVTLLGPGGMGKTRLAVELARGWEQGDRYFVPLADCDRGAQLPQAILQHLGIACPPGADPFASVLEYLAGRPTLLVLDNAEQLVEAGLAAFVQTLCAKLPLLRLVFTSRRRIGGEGEQVLNLEPLATPELPGTPESLVEFPAVQLFLDRAQRIQPDFQVTLRNASALGTLCLRLEGLPLALELAAAWVQTLSPAQILERLGDEHFLVSRRRDIAERHRSLRAAFEANLPSMAPTTQKLLAACSLFNGGWSREAAEALCPGEDVLEGLQTLCESSLIQSQPEQRFTMLESLRRFAQNLLPPDERVCCLERHFAYFLELAGSYPCDALGRESAKSALECLQAERDNLRLAFSGALERGNADAAVTLALRLSPFLMLRGGASELAEWLERALGGSLSEPLQATALAHLGGLELERRSSQQALQYLDQALEIATIVGAPELKALVLHNLGRHAEIHQDSVLAHARYTEALALLEKAGDSALRSSAYAGLAQLAIRGQEFEQARELLVWGEQAAQRAGRHDLQANSLYNRAYLAMMADDLAGALVWLEESGQLARDFGMLHLLARVQNSVGNTAQMLGELDKAHDALLDSALLFLRLRSQMGLSYPLWNLAQLYCTWGDWSIALPLLACSLRLWQELDQPLTKKEHTEVETTRQRGVEALGKEREALLWHQGLRLTPEEALAKLPNRTQPTPSSTPLIT
jgi:predicted ATPase